MFTISPNADVNGTCALASPDSLKDVTARDMLNAFGDSADNAYYEPERGYDGDEWYFTDEEGEVMGIAYRYGMMRVRGRDPSDKKFDAFVAFIKEKTGK